jgi:hypothetical protein
MFRHVVLLKWTPEATPEQRRAAADGIRTLPQSVPGIRAFSVGEDAGIEPGTYDLVIVADFDDADGYRAYRDHPAHRTLIHRLTDPIRAARVAVQHELR